MLRLLWCQLVALMDALISRVNLPNFKYAKLDPYWLQYAIPSDISIIFVSMEIAVTPVFMMHLWSSKGWDVLQGLLSMRSISQLLKGISETNYEACDLDAQLVLLSATVPVNMVEDLNVAFGTAFAYIVRGCTMRPRLFYGIKIVEGDESMFASLKQLLVSLRQQLLHNNAYCPTRNMTTDMATQIAGDLSWTGAMSYHGGMEQTAKGKAL